MITKELEDRLIAVFAEARAQRYKFVTLEHLLLVLLDNDVVAETLGACDANIDDLRRDLSVFIKGNVQTVPGRDEVDSEPTLEFQRVIQRAIMYVQSTGNGKEEVTSANVLYVMYRETNSHATLLLTNRGAAQLDVKNYVLHGIRKAPSTA